MMDSKVGTEGSYGKAPFADGKVARSIPPITKGAGSAHDAARPGQHGTAGKNSNFKAAAAFATKQTSPRGC